jgi:hypothetical protein
LSSLSRAGAATAFATLAACFLSSTSLQAAKNNEEKLIVLVRFNLFQSAVGIGKAEGKVAFPLKEAFWRTSQRAVLDFGKTRVLIDDVFLYRFSDFLALEGAIGYKKLHLPELECAISATGCHLPALETSISYKR